MSTFCLASPGRRARALVALAAVATSLTLAACGDDDETSTSTMTSTEETGATGATGATGGSGSTSSGDLDAALEDALRENLTGPQGLTDEQADCAIDKIFAEVSPEEIQKAAQSGDVPEDLFETAFDAGVECGQ